MNILHKKTGEILKTVDAENLRGANLQDADLRGAYLHGADLQYANLQDADLQDADLYGADLHGANLRGADLRGANLQDANLYGADLQRERIMEHTKGDKPKLKYVNLGLTPEVYDKLQAAAIKEAVKSGKLRPLGTYCRLILERHVKA